MLCRFVSSSYVYKWHVAYPMDILNFLVSYKYSLQFSDPQSSAKTTIIFYIIGSNMRAALGDDIYCAKCL